MDLRVLTAFPGDPRRAPKKDPCRPTLLSLKVPPSFLLRMPFFKKITGKRDSHFPIIFLKRGLFNRELIGKWGGGLHRDSTYLPLYFPLKKALEKDRNPFKKVGLRKFSRLRLPTAGL